MVSTDIEDRALLVSVIQTLQQQLEQQQAQAERDRKEARREIERLMKMLEGLTRQLDELLRDRDEERRAELARIKEEALALAQAALDAQKSPTTGPQPVQRLRHRHAAPAPASDGGRARDVHIRDAFVAAVREGRVVPAAGPAVP